MTPILSIVNNVTKNLGVQVSLDPMVVLSLILRGISILFSIITGLNYSSAEGVQASPFLQILTSTYLWPSVIVLLTEVRWHSMVDLICISLMSADDHLVLDLVAICMFSLEKMSMHLLPIFKSGYLFSCYWVIWVPCVF